MKNILFTILLLGLCMTTGYAQDTRLLRIPLIGEQAPKFTAESTMGKITFPDDNNSKWTILFSHPSDFTPVCSSEILELAEAQDDFNKLNARIIVISTDAVSSHIEWVKSMENIKYKGRETVKITFPLVSDKTLEISKLYGMIHSFSSETKDVRGVFIIDPTDKIRAIFFYPMNVGRNIEEIRRTLLALETSEKQSVLTPANWEPGQDVLLPAPATSTDADQAAKKNTTGMYNYSWYMWFKKLP